MNCRELEPQLTAYLAGELDDGTARAARPAVRSSGHRHLLRFELHDICPVEQVVRNRLCGGQWVHGKLTDPSVIPSAP